MNFILMAIGMVIVILGFILMSGGGSDETTFAADIFSARRIKLAPVVCFVGFISIIYAIIRKPSDPANDSASNSVSNSASDNN